MTCVLRPFIQENVLEFTDPHESNLFIVPTDEDPNHTGGSIMLHLPEPVWNWFKCASACDVIGHYGPVGTAVVALRYGAEALLTRRVPHLHLQKRVNNTAQSPSSNSGKIKCLLLSYSHIQWTVTVISPFETIVWRHPCTQQMNTPTKLTHFRLSSVTRHSTGRKHINPNQQTVTYSETRHLTWLYYCWYMKIRPSWNYFSPKVRDSSSGV